ncbi:MAG: phosphotransferase [Myxococcota bacterium]|nr:phosphotransferase [Myxococcota bacterium]
MTQPWDPVHPVNEALARQLLSDRFPDLALDDLIYQGRGWDNDVWRCGALVFRFPHRPEGVTLIEREWRVLPHLVGRLPLDIPEPVGRGEVSEAYPSPFLAYRWIPGELPHRLSLAPEQRAAAAEPLAGFLRALHAISTAEAAEWGVPGTSNRREVASRLPWARKRAEQLASTPYRRSAERALAAMDPLPPEVSDPELALIHGDLHAGQVLFDADRRVSGILDWGEVAVGDPAFDLQLVDAFLPPGARSRFWEVYGPVSEPVRARARFIALSYGLAILVNALDTGDAALRDEAARSLEHGIERA